jgi:hypothetical protein
VTESCWSTSIRTSTTARSARDRRAISVPLGRVTNLPPAADIRLADLAELTEAGASSRRHGVAGMAKVVQALDGIGPRDEPLDVARFGPKFDAQAVPVAATGSRARFARRCAIGVPPTPDPATAAVQLRSELPRLADRGARP